MRIPFLVMACSAVFAAANVSGEAKPDANGIVEFIRYSSSDPRCEGDLYLPKKLTEATPVALLIHGGGWTAMDRYSVAGIAEWMQRDLGFAVYNAGYRLANKDHVWPCCGEDCVAAARFVLDGGLAKWGVKPRRIVVIGGSAGGHLTLWTALSLKPSEVAGAVAISCVGDPRPDCKLVPKRYEGLFGAKPTEKLFDSMDPRGLIRPNGPAVLMTHAKEDTVVPIASARAFEAAYRAAGNEVEFVTYSEKDEPNEAGHCIWRPGSAPHRLLEHLEETIRRWFWNRGILPGKPPAVFTGGGRRAMHAALEVAKAPVTVAEGTIDLPSYAISAPEKSPVFDCKWSYQRARRSIYPYALNDNLYAEKSEMKAWKALYLENEYLKICVLPEIGGRLFYAIDKTNGYDIFYRQDAIKPANVGMNGAWISGGVEWNVFHHHRISTQMPCDWRLVENADGSKSIWLGETERRHRMSWAIGITLRPGSSCMEIDGRLVNCTEDSNSMLFWANVATHANPDYQIVFPQNTEFAAYHAKSSICHWPVCREPFTGVDAYTNNVDVSWWKNHTVGNSLFAWELPENFIGGYDHGKDAGTMLVGNRHIVRGGKFWSWGPNSGWPTKILTDRRGHYVELMVAAYSDSQPDYNWSVPGETKVFRQYWYGVRNLKGIKMGDETFALNMDKTAGDELLLAVNATRCVDRAEVRVEEKINADEKVKKGGGRRIVYSKIVSLAPDKPWSATVDLPGIPSLYDLTMTVTELPSTPQPLNPSISYTPVRHDLSKPCPAEVKAPKRPKDIASTEECYFTGLRAEQFHQPYVDANDYFEEVLRRDPLDSRANTRLGVYWRRHWDLEKAERHLRAALVRPTRDYTRVKDGEAMYNLGLVLDEKGDTEGAVDALYRAVWTYEYNSAANLKLARIYARKGDWKMALDRVNEAIAYNAHNLDAKCLKLSIIGGALGDDILSFDPLNAYAIYLTKPRAEFESFMRDEPESYVELALKFRANGFPDEAKRILETIDAKVAHPTVKLHLGKVEEFLAMDLTEWRPFRRETKDALEELRKLSGLRRLGSSESAKIHYCLGNVYGNVDTAKAMRAWNESIALSVVPAIKQSNNQTINHYPYALRNLGYGHWKWTHDYAKALDFYRRAIAAKPDEAFFLEEFDHVAEEAKLPVAERYAMLKSHHGTAAKRSGSLTAEIVTGIACGDFDRALGMLRTKYLPTFEGAANMHDIYVDALLGKAAELERAGDFRGAIKLYGETEEYPANQQVFVEFTKRRARDAQVWHLTGLAYERIGEKEKARELFEKSAAVDTLRTDYCYWKALSLRKLGREAEARAIGEAMVKKGSVRIDDYVDFFDYEGNRYGKTVEAKNAAAARTLELGKRILKE